MATGLGLVFTSASHHPEPMMRPSLCLAAGLLAALSAFATPAKRLYFDQAHGQMAPGGAVKAEAEALSLEVVVSTEPITAAKLEGVRLLYLRAPSQEIGAEERAVIVAFVRGGGSLLLVLDQEQRQSLAKTKVNEIIAPFGLQLTPDTEYLHNCGAIAKAGAINPADRRIPYSGGRAVVGGTAFAWRLDRDGHPAEPFAAYTQVGRARVVVLGEGMATLHMGTQEGERLSGVPNDPAHTTYWGPDSAVFMSEVLAWLVE